MTDTTTNSSTPPSRQALRRFLRTQRRQLNTAQQNRAAMKILQHLRCQPLLWRSRHIALYLASDGEVSPHYITEALWAAGKHCYLPILHPQKSGYLLFAEYTPNMVLKVNRYGILEPPLRGNTLRRPEQLDLVLMPLVGFDGKGHRLGMGGGYYDRTFAFKRQERNRKPYLVGLAHQCQQLEHCPTDEWDIPVAMVVSDGSVIKPTQKN